MNAVNQKKAIVIFAKKKLKKNVRKNDKTKLYECDYPDCFNFFESYDKLKIHKSNFHGIAYDGNLNMNMNNLQIKYGPMNMMNRGILPNQIIKTIIPYMAPQGPGLPIQQNQNNNTSQMNALNNNIIPNNLNNIINTLQNLNNIPGNIVS